MPDILHLVILASALLTTTAVIRRCKRVYDLGDGYSWPLLFWSLALLLTTIFFSFIVYWDYYPESVFAVDARLWSPWLILLILVMLIASAYKIIRHFHLFRPLYAVLLLSMAAIMLMYGYVDYLQESRSHFDIVNDVLPFAMLASVQFYVSFLFLFMGLATLGHHFWRWRLLGFLLISSSLLMLGALNVGRWGAPQVFAPWEAGRYSLEGLTSLLQRSREVLYLFFLAGFYLASLPHPRNDVGRDEN